MTTRRQVFAIIKPFYKPLTLRNCC